MVTTPLLLKVHVFGRLHMYTRKWEEWPKMCVQENGEEGSTNGAAR